MSSSGRATPSVRPGGADLDHRDGGVRQDHPGEAAGGGARPPSPRAGLGVPPARVDAPARRPVHRGGAGLRRAGPLVVCGKYKQVPPIVFGRADTIVRLDHHRLRQTLRVAARTARREVLWNGNRECLRALWVLRPGDESIIRWTWDDVPRAGRCSPRWRPSGRRAGSTWSASAGGAPWTGGLSRRRRCGGRTRGRGARRGPGPPAPARPPRGRGPSGAGPPRRRGGSPAARPGR